MVLTLSEFGDGDTEEKFHCQSSFNEAFKKMQHIRREGKLCDIVLRTQNSRFSAHRIVLASQIPYFEGMLLSGMIEQDKNEIEIAGVEPHTLQVLIDFAYTGYLMKFFILLLIFFNLICILYYIIFAILLWLRDKKIIYKMKCTLICP